MAAFFNSMCDKCGRCRREVEPGLCSKCISTREAIFKDLRSIKRQLVICASSVTKDDEADIADHLLGIGMTMKVIIDRERRKRFGRSEEELGNESRTDHAARIKELNEFLAATNG